MNEERIVSLLKSIADLMSPTQRPAPVTKELVKSVDSEEQRMALFVVLEPDVVDAHGDTYSADVVEKACNNFNLHCEKANLFHRIDTEEAKIVQSFVTPSAFDMQMPDGTVKEISKGTWLQWWYFPETEVGETIWKMVKSGDINGVSVGCQGLVEELE